MADVESLTADLEALKSARRMGARSIHIGDRSVEYGTDAEMARAIAATQAEIDSLQGGRPRVFVIRSSKGW